MPSGTSSGDTIPRICSAASLASFVLANEPRMDPPSPSLRRDKLRIVRKISTQMRTDGHADKSIFISVYLRPSRLKALILANSCPFAVVQFLAHLPTGAPILTRARSPSEDLPI